MVFSLWPKKKAFGLLAIVLVYVAIGVSFKLLLGTGLLEPIPAPIEEVPEVGVAATTVQGKLQAAQRFVDTQLLREGGHVNLYWLSENATRNDHNQTNSEAVSYYLLWAAQEGDKEAFDRELDFVERNMLHPRFGYMRWRVEADGSIVGDGENIATDADLRAIKALFLAEERWGDARYTRLIDRIASGVEMVAITDDNLLAPYGGIAGVDSAWTANEIYLSYVDWTVIDELAQRRGEPWLTVQRNMKRYVLDAQIHNGLYNSYLNSRRQYGNGIDGGGYSINSLWIMVRNAESDDPDLRASARESLDFYKEQFHRDKELYPQYSSSGSPMAGSDTPWVYALVGRAAVALGDDVFADQLIEKLLEKQVLDVDSPMYGGFPEGDASDLRIGQFTTQESILTLQDYLRSRGLGR